MSALLTLPSWVRFWHPQVNYESKRLKEKRPSIADWIAPIKKELVLKLNVKLALLKKHHWWFFTIRYLIGKS